MGAEVTDADVDRERAPCQKCDEPISLEADSCPECGHEPSSSRMFWGGACVLVGGVLSMTGIGALLGIPLALWGLLLIVKSFGASPAVPNEEESGEKPWYMKSFVTLYRERRAD